MKKLYAVICAAAVLTDDFNSDSQAGEIGFFFSPLTLSPIIGVVVKEWSTKVTLAPIPKLLLVSDQVPKLGVFEPEPKLELRTPFLSIAPTPTNSLRLDEKVLERPTEVPFPNFYYVHEKWKVGNDFVGFDSFGLSFKLSPKSELVLPYFRWDYPSRKEERISVGVFWSRKF